MSVLTNSDYYGELGLKPVINGFETLTRYGGTIMDPQVFEAMSLAGAQLVSLLDFQDRIANKIIAVTKHESVFICAGGAAGIALSVAACMVSANGISENKLPRRTGITDIHFQKYKIIIHKNQRNPYDQAVYLSGAELVEIGLSTFQTSPQELEDAITSEIAAIIFFAGKIFERYAIPLAEVIKIAHAHGLPVIVDAAAQLPPKSNLWKFTDMGADLVIFSGGKGLRGPQDTGLLFGKKALIDIIKTISAPHQGFGRTMKVSKENLAGMFVALSIFLETDWDAEYIKQVKLLERLIAMLGPLPRVSYYILPSGRHGQQYPRLVIKFHDKDKAFRNSVIDELANGDPIILVGPLDEDENAIYVNAFSLCMEELETLVSCVKELVVRSVSDV